MVGIVEQPYEPTTVEEKLDTKNEMKAKGTLLMRLPNKDQLKFHSYQDGKLNGSNREELEIQGEVIELEDINLKLLRSLPSEWKTHALIWRNKAEIETISLDDFYKNLKIYEPELTGSSSINQNPDVVICAFLASQPNSPQLAREDLEQIDPDDLEEMDLKWEMAMLTIRARRFIKRTGRNLDINDYKVGFDMSKVECFNCHKNENFARECRAPKNQENRSIEYGRKIVPVENPTENALIAQDEIRDWSYQAEEEHTTKFALMVLTSLGSSSNSDYEVDSCSKTCLKAYATLKEQYDSLSSDYKKSQFKLLSYKAGLQSVEERLFHYKKNEVVFTEK
nr:hypothetical protein [Tanacetum cinerariifolium]